MTVQAIKAPIILEEGWHSLLDQKAISSHSFITQFFKDYMLRVDALSDGQKKTAFKMSRWQVQAIRQILRDYYMRFQIEHNADLLSKTLSIARIIEPEDNLFSDIDTILQTPFDPAWSILHHLIDFTLMTSESNHYMAIMTTCPDGNLRKCGGLVNQEKLLRYRFVHHVLLHDIKKAAETKLPLFKALAASRSTFMEMLNPNSNTYRSKVYYYTLLKCNEKLRQSLSRNICFSLLDRNGNTSMHAADEMAHDLTSEDDNVVSKSLSTLRKLKRKSDKSLFSLLQKDESAPLQPALTTLSRPDTPEKEFEKQFYETGQFTALSHSHRVNFLKQYLSYLKERPMAPQDLFFKLSEVAQSLFQNSTVVDCFKIEVEILAMPLYSAVNQLHEGKKSKLLTNAWKTLFETGGSESCRKAILSDLNTECVRLMRKTEASDLCANVVKYLAESATATSNSSEDTSSSETASTSAIKSKEPPPFTITDLFNSLASLVGHSVVMADSKSQMLANYETCIKLAYEALEAPYVNLLVAQAIYAGINTVGVASLKLEDKIGRKERLNLRAIEQIFDPNNNYKNYRAFCKESKYPVIPYLGLISHELTMACEVKRNQEQVEVVKALVGSFDKSRHLLKAVLPIRRFSP
ncbi:RasGEF domain-containing protein [Estrella lausannensis]|uniref:Ras-GEF domain-containing protein n=1 Tax=Estrella lausannensis TaxID=483423 RepID=A0A0H5DNK9_9BACT|nr:RasGEF domain-containing protein [Estrella lausannensis]CRX37941.1 hypothetical protein ELAC_0586 [Estrella lausannensis]